MKLERRGVTITIIQPSEIQRYKDLGFKEVKEIEEMKRVEKPKSKDK